jgi:hypothetical protein
MGADDSCLTKFDVSSAVPAVPQQRALLTTCPRNGLSNQLLALLSAAAIASDLGVGFWIPPLLGTNLQEGPRAGAPGAERASFCASCYEALAQAETTPLAEVLNVSRLEAVGGVQLATGGGQLLPASFGRYDVLDVCRAQHYELAFGESPCARDEEWSSQNWATPGPLNALPKRARGGAAYACLRDAMRAQLANTSAAPLWIKFGSSHQEYYQLCGRPPVALPPFFEFSSEVVAVGASVWPLLLSGLSRDAPPYSRATGGWPHSGCAHIRLSLPGEGWDQLGSPFTEAVPSQVQSFRDWLRYVLAKGRSHIPVLVLSDAPWLLQQVVPELGGCLATGRCALADSLVDVLVPARPVSRHFRSAAAQLACAEADHLLLTPKSSFSKIIRMLATRHQARPNIAYTLARVRFHAPLALQPFLRRARECAGLRPQASHRECLVRRVADAILLAQERLAALSLAAGLYPALPTTVKGEVI